MHDDASVRVFGGVNNLFDDKGYAHLKNQLMDMIKSRPEDEIPMLEQVGMS